MKALLFSIISSLETSYFYKIYLFFFFFQNLSLKLYVLSVFFSMLDYLGKMLLKCIRNKKWVLWECLDRNKNIEFQKERKTQVGKLKDSRVCMFIWFSLRSSCVHSLGNFVFCNNFVIISLLYFITTKKHPPSKFIVVLDHSSYKYECWKFRRSFPRT